MKNDKNFNYNIKPISIAIGATILTLIFSILSNFGKIYYRNQFGFEEYNGTALIIMFSLFPIFFKGYREYIWTKKGLITLFIALAINLPIAIYCSINRYNLFGYIF